MKSDFTENEIMEVLLDGAWLQFRFISEDAAGVTATRGGIARKVTRSTCRKDSSHPGQAHANEGLQPAGSGNVPNPHPAQAHTSEQKSSGGVPNPRA